MKIIDVKGMACPMPLIKTKRALQELEKDETLKVIIDNDTSVSNVLHFLHDNNIPVTQKKDGNITELTINKTDVNIDDVEVENYCEVDLPTVNDFVLVFSKNKIGEGNDELGQMLVTGFLNTFKEMNRMPKKIIFLNSGVFLVLKGSQVLPVLKEYEESGVELLACGACLDFYEKTKDIAVGRVSNAYDILNATLDAGKVLNF